MIMPSIFEVSSVPASPLPLLMTCAAYRNSRNFQRADSDSRLMYSYSLAPLWVLSPTTSKVTSMRSSLPSGLVTGALTILALYTPAGSRVLAPSTPRTSYFTLAIALSPSAYPGRDTLLRSHRLVLVTNMYIANVQEV